MDMLFIKETKDYIKRDKIKEVLVKYQLNGLNNTANIEYGAVGNSKIKRRRSNTT